MKTYKTTKTPEEIVEALRRAYSDDEFDYVDLEATCGELLNDHPPPRPCISARHSVFLNEWPEETCVEGRAYLLAHGKLVPTGKVIRPEANDNYFIIEAVYTSNLSGKTRTDWYTLKRGVVLPMVGGAE